jgi:hypothetical protein
VVGLKLSGEGDEALLKDRRRALLFLVHEALELVAEGMTERGGFGVKVAVLFDDFFRGEACHDCSFLHALWAMLLRDFGGGIGGLNLLIGQVGSGEFA